MNSALKDVLKVNNEAYKDSITTYFYLDNQIASIYEALKELRYRHENRNYYTSVVFHDLGFSVSNFKLEREVIDFADAERLALKRIERLKKRVSYFDILLNVLDPQEQYYLTQKYKQGKNIKEQVEIEEKALVIHEKMEEYKHDLSRYRQASIERAERFKTQQEKRHVKEEARKGN